MIGENVWARVLGICTWYLCFCHLTVKMYCTVCLNGIFLYCTPCIGGGGGEILPADLKIIVSVSICFFFFSFFFIFFSFFYFFVNCGSLNTGVYEQKNDSQNKLKTSWWGFSLSLEFMYSYDTQNKVKINVEDFTSRLLIECEPVWQSESLQCLTQERSVLLMCLVHERPALLQCLAHQRSVLLQCLVLERSAVLLGVVH